MRSIGWYEQVRRSFDVRASMGYVCLLAALLIFALLASETPANARQVDTGVTASLTQVLPRMNVACTVSPRALGAAARARLSNRTRPGRYLSPVGIVPDNLSIS